MVSTRSSAQQVLVARSRVGRWVTTALIGAAVLTGPMLVASPASAANIISSTFSPAFAKNGTVLTLTVNTSNDVKSVKAGTQCITANLTSWTFPSTAGPGNGIQTTTVNAYKDPACIGSNVSGTASFTLDNIAPVINGTRVPVANAAGWNNTSVAVNFTCSDVNAVPACGPNATVATQGANQSVTGTAVDAAGNTTATTVNTISVDLTAPTLTGVPTAAANANGWYNSNVSINWTCTDALSGFTNGGTCPGNSTITGEGSSLTATATAADTAGNSTTTTTSAVRIDRTAPVTVASAPPAWNNTNLTVALSATDALSGVANTQYKVDGGATQTGSSVLFNTDGDHVLQYWSTDRAGNTEITRSVHVKIDKTSPTISHKQSPVANAQGWNNTAVAISFTCNDTLSGIASCTAPQTVSTEGANQSRIGTATDIAGNVANDPATVSIDTTAPSITAAPDRSPNALGWYADDVTISFACTDSLSGVDTCSGAVGLAEGSNQSTQGTSADAAGNVSTATVNNINIDKTAPTLIGSPTTAPDQNGFYRGPVTIHWTCTDALSGFATGACPANSVISGNGTGLFASGAVSDKAGNTAVSSSAAVNIDASAPTTTSDTPAGWQTADVVVTLNASDAGPSGVQSTFLQLDGSDPAEGTSVLVTEGKHVITFWSVDNAGNAETPHTVTVDVDKSLPGISHTNVPTPNDAGWNNTNVLITFTCNDQANLSGLATCTPASQGVITNGAGQTVTGTATDVAGNTASDLATVNVDKAAPSITATPQSSPNANGWYNSPVTVDFGCVDQDGLSGITQCSLAQTLGEGTNQTASGNAKDNADNTASASVEHINVDTTSPQLSAAPTTTPNGNGWYNGDVTIVWSCDDALSGIFGDCPSPSTFTAEGTGLTVATSVTDLAGNTTSTTSTPVSIDRHAPITSADAPTSWVNQSTTVHLDASDSLSGVRHTAFILDGAAVQNGTSVIISTEGVHTLEYWSLDNADNEEPHHTATIEIDKSNPTIAVGQLPDANGGGWNNSDVTVTFTCVDQVGLSGIKSCTQPQSITTEGRAQQVVGNAEDNAGNTASATHTVNLDKTPPTIVPSISDSANALGWHRNPVGVSFACVDGLSGVGSCTDPTILVEGEDQAVTGTVVDNADNSALATVNDIDIDLTAPSINGNVPAPNAAGWYKADVVVNWVCSDTLSGLASCPTNSTITGEGSSVSASGQAVDKADNVGSATVAGIHIDRTAPISSWSPPSGWSPTDVTVHVVASDNLSGVVHNYIEVDGGAPVADADVIISEGEHHVRFWSVDAASNLEIAHTVVVRVDKTAPTIGHTQIPAPNAGGWNNADVTVGFVCADSLSGIASCTEPSTLVAETAGTLLTGTAVDNAGNQTSDDVTVKLDKTPPTVKASTDRAPNSQGWYNASVNVAFECTDELSGIADCPAPRTLAEGAAQSATATGHDVAGNAATAGVSGINIDTTAPTLSGTPTSGPNSNGWYRSDVDIHWTCADALSGTTCPSDSTISGEGQDFVATASVTDVAGNTTTSSSNPAVRIDRTAPSTTASAPSGWVNHAVTVSLDPSDGLSGVAATQYSLDGAAALDGTSVEITTQGEHTLAYWSIDAAGNEEAHRTISVRIDETAPTIGHTQSPAANAAGWNNVDVTVTFSCADTGGAGLGSCTSPQTATGEGQNLPLHGTAVDNAGNSAHDDVTVNIDRTAPGISEAPGRAAPNGNGWYRAPIDIAFSCSDALSGIATCSTTPFTVTHGVAQHVDGHATDVAGNPSSATVSDLNVDTGAPTISGAPTTSPNVDGWYAGDVVIHWTCGDDLSGIDGPCPSNTTITGEGAALSATATVHDLAGNAATASVADIHIDRTAPVTTDDVSSVWHNSSVIVNFSVTDNLSGSHHTNFTVDGGLPSSGSSVTVGHGSHSLAYWSTDRAGNLETVKTVMVLVDTIPPTISGAATTAPNSNGWYRAPITVRFTCTDQSGLSGIASCPEDVTLNGDGANQSVGGTAIDKAGNQTSITVSGLNLDRTAPSIAFQGVTNGASYTLGAAPTPSCTASDALSGVAQPCAGALTGGNANGVGQFTYTATVNDRAGNATTSTVTFRIGYRFDGFLQPINDTAHQIGTSTSIFKAGSTVPVKFQLRRADGTVVQSVTSPQWLAPSKGAATSAAVDETLYTVASTAGESYRADGTSQYIYNWGTNKSAAGFYWRIGVRLDDGSTYYVNIGLR